MGRTIDWNNHVGERWGRLVILRPVKDKRNRTVYECQCDCGNVCNATYQHLTNHKKQSCGCLMTEIREGKTHPKIVTEGMTNKDKIREHSKEWKEYRRLINDYPRLYNIWHGIKKRTGKLNWNDDAHCKWYVERGIKLCDEWMDYGRFAKWSIANGYDDTLTIDRIDNNGNYEPSNCRWTDQKTQQRNRSNNHNVTIDGETHCVAEWIEQLGLTYGQVYCKVYKHGMTVEDVLTDYRRSSIGQRKPKKS